MKSVVKWLYVLLIVIEVVIMLRFTFLLLGADDQNVFVDYILIYSEYLVSPFDDLVDSDWEIGKFFIEIDALVSLVIYMILGFGLSQLVRMSSYER